MESTERRGELRVLHLLSRARLIDYSGPDDWEFVDFQGFLVSDYYRWLARIARGYEAAFAKPLLHLVDGLSAEEVDQPELWKRTYLGDPLPPPSDLRGLVKSLIESLPDSLDSKWQGVGVYAVSIEGLIRLREALRVEEQRDVRP